MADMLQLDKVETCSSTDIQILEDCNVLYYRDKGIAEVTEPLTEDCLVLIYKDYNKTINITDMSVEDFKEGFTFICENYRTKLCDIRYIKTKLIYDKILDKLNKRSNLCQ